MTESDELLDRGGAHAHAEGDDPLSDDALTGDFRIWQRVRGHRYSLDDVLTAREALDAVAGRVLGRACDLGCGIGSVLLMVAWARPELPLVGIEAQDVSFGLARRNVARNHLEARVRLVHGDLRDVATRVAALEGAPSAAAPSEIAPSEAAPSEIAPAKAAPSEMPPSEAAPSEIAPSEIAPSAAAPPEMQPFEAAPSEIASSEAARFGLVTGTPPYVPPGKSTPSPDPQKAHARVELRGGIEDYLAAASSLVAPDGVVVVCGDARFPERAFEGARAVALHPRRQRDAVPRAGRPPLFSVWTFTPAPGPFEHAPPFVARDEDGRRTPAYL
ncbi:MAG: methyltransferase, partial [Myxococcales bacterium]|nr:methyltransferase [Myxococcales bacterium]